MTVKHILTSLDLGAALTRLRVPINALFMFDREMALDGIKGHVLEDRITDDDGLLQLLTIIGAPDVAINFVNGGGTKAIDRAIILIDRQTNRAVGLSKVQDGYEIQEVENIASIGEMSSYIYGKKTSKPPSVLLPKSLTLPSYVNIMHMMDCFRRESYKNLLNHKFVKEVSLSTDEYAKTLLDAIKSDDARWLLPSYILLAGKEMLPDTEEIFDSIEMLEASGLIKISKASQNTITLTEKGTAASLEFFKDFRSATHIKRQEIIEGQLLETANIFVAHTSYSNHFAEINDSEKQGQAVSYDCLSREELEKEFSYIFRAY